MIGWHRFSAAGKPKRYLLFRSERPEELRYASLDMQKGEVNELIKVTDDVSADFLIGGSEDGNFTLLSIFLSEPHREQLWLLRMATGEAELVVEGNDIRGDISPDGRYLAYSETECEAETCNSTVWILDIRSGELIEVGPGINPVWVQS